MPPKKQLTTTAFAQHLLDSNYSREKPDYAAATEVAKLIYGAHFRTQRGRICAFMKKYKKDILMHLNTLQEMAVVHPPVPRDAFGNSKESNNLLVSSATDDSELCVPYGVVNGSIAETDESASSLYSQHKSPGSANQPATAREDEDVSHSKTPNVDQNTHISSQYSEEEQGQGCENNNDISAVVAGETATSPVEAVGLEENYVSSPQCSSCYRIFGALSAQNITTARKRRSSAPAQFTQIKKEKVASNIKTPNIANPTSTMLLIKQETSLSAKPKIITTNKRTTSTQSTPIKTEKEDSNILTPANSISNVPPMEQDPAPTTTQSSCEMM